MSEKPEKFTTPVFRLWQWQQYSTALGNYHYCTELRHFHPWHEHWKLHYPHFMDEQTIFKTWPRSKGYNRYSENQHTVCQQKQNWWPGSGYLCARWKLFGRMESKQQSTLRHACQLTSQEGLWGSSSQTLFVPGNKTLLSTLGKNRPWNASQPVKTSLCHLSSKGLHQPTHAYI